MDNVKELALQGLDELVNQQKTAQSSSFGDVKTAAPEAPEKTKQSALAALDKEVALFQQGDAQYAKSGQIVEQIRGIEQLQTQLNNLPGEIEKARKELEVANAYVWQAENAQKMGGDLLGLSAEDFKVEYARRSQAAHDVSDRLDALENSRAQLEDSVTYNNNFLKIMRMSDEDRKSLEAYAEAVAGSPSANSDKGFFALRDKGYSFKEIYQLAETMVRYNNEVEAQKRKEDAAAFANNLPITGTIASWGANFVGGISGFGATVDQTIKSATGLSGYNVADPNHPLYAPGDWGNTVQQTVAQNIAGDEDAPEWERNARKILSLAYQGLNSAADSGLKIGTAIATGGGSAVSSGLFFMGAAQSEFQAQSAAGVTTDKAFLSAVVKGGLELATEKYSVDNLLSLNKPSTWKQVLKNAAIQGGVEVTEEELNFVAGILADAAIHGEDIDKKVKDMMAAKGISREEARKQVYMELAQEAADTALTSFISGGLSAGATGTAQKLQYDASQKNNKGQQVQDDAQSGENVTPDLIPGQNESVGTAPTLLVAGTQLPAAENAEHRVQMPQIKEQPVPNINSAENLNGGILNDLTHEQPQRTAAGTDGTGAGVLYGSSQRNGSPSAAEPAGSLAGRTGTAAAGRGLAADRARTQIERSNLGKHIRQTVNAASLGIAEGTDRDNLKIIPQELYDEGMRTKAEQVYQETGKRVVYVLGPIECTNSRGTFRVQGVKTEEQMIVRADHPKYTAEQIADHESYHGMSDVYGSRLNDSIVERIKQTFSEEEFNAVLDQYILSLRNVIDVNGARSGREFQKQMGQIIEEVLADAHAGMNAWGNGATRFTDTVNQFLDENRLSRKDVQENGVRETTGPPTDNYSAEEYDEQAFKEQYGLKLPVPEGWQKENTAGGGVRYSVDETNQDGQLKIYPGMDEALRASILKQKKIYAPEYDATSPVTGPQILRLKGKYVTEARSLLTELARQCGDFRSDLHNADVDISFSYSNKSLKESVNKQAKRGGGAETFGKMLTVLPEICESAAEIEAHTDRYVGTARADGNLKEMHILLGAFWDGKYCVPVQLEIKEYTADSGLHNKLYVTVTIKNEAGVTPRISVTNVADENARSRPASVISVADLIANVNDETGGLVKYIPDQMLNSSQLAAKQKALAEDAERLGDMRYEYAVQQGNTSTAEKMLQEKANHVGYTAGSDWRMAHKAPTRDTGVSLDRADEMYGGDGSIYSPWAHRYYGEGRAYDSKAISIFAKAMGKPDANITVYRAVPSDILGTRLQNGDWVSPTREYAEEHGDHYFDGNYRIVSQSVPAKHLLVDGNSIHEFGYDNGRTDEIYKNTPNNVKLAAITYDDQGDLIPLSKRYDEENADARYSVDDGDETDFDRVNAELAAEQQRWKDAWLRDRLGDEGLAEYRKHLKQQEDQRTAQRKQEAAAQRETKADKRKLQREYRESKADAAQRLNKLAASKPTQAKKDLRIQLMNLFSTPDGRRAEIGKVIDGYADRLIKSGQLTEADRKAFFDRMYEAGMMTVPADEYYALGRSAVVRGKIYVDDSMRADFGDDWNDFRRRAFAAGVYLTGNKADPGIDVWNDDLSYLVPGMFDAEDTQLRQILERIVQLAEDGKDEHVSLAEYTAQLAERDHVREDDVLDGMEKQMDWALRTFAEKAGLEIKLKEKAVNDQASTTKENVRLRIQLQQERQDRKDASRQQQERKALQELQQKTLKSLQWLNKNRYRAPEELRAEFDRVLSDIDIYAVGAANAMNWSNKYGATWKDLAQMYLQAKDNDPNFMPSKELEMIVSRLNDQKIADMDLDALNNLYRAAVGLRTEFNNRNNVINDEMNRLFAEVYSDSKGELKAAAGGYTGKILDKLFNMEQLTPMNFLQRMASWNPNSTFFSMAKQLEKGEREMRAFKVKANRMLESFLTEHADWVKKADGQGKDGVWYTIEVPELLEFGKGDKPIFGDTVTVYMTPAQKVHMYLESKNTDNLRHMAGGRTFADKELYSKGKRKEAFAQGRTIRMAPETVKAIVSNMTAEELELARILEKFYNDFSKQEINRISNILYGYDKAMGKFYAPIFTNQNYVQSEIGIFDQTAEGVGNLKAREYSKNPSYNISAFDAFERNTDQTARFVGMAIPARNWQTLLNWRERNNSMGDVITHEWGDEALKYINNLLIDLQGGKAEEKISIEKGVEKLMSNYISSVFGANLGIVLKQTGSIPMAGAYLGMRNAPSIRQVHEIDRDIIRKYTQELDWRGLGYSTPETKQLKENPNWTQTNKTTRFLFGGGAITAMDSWAASTLWPWAENKVRRENPELDIGTQEQIDAGESPFYKKVAEEFDNAVARSQSTSDQMHQSTMRKSKNPLVRMFTMFKSDSAQTYNAMRQMIGEALYHKKNGNTAAAAKANRAVGTAFLAALGNFMIAEGVNLITALIKNKGKKYRDEDEELTFSGVAEEIIGNVLKSYAGIMVGGEELADMIGATLTGEKWYEVESMEVSLLQDVINLGANVLEGARDLIADGVNVAANGGDLGEYFHRHGNDLVGELKDAATEIASYLGIPADNVEAYLIGLVKWIPGFEAAYDDAFATATKSGLSSVSGMDLEIRVSNILDNRNISQSNDTARALAALYEAGYDAVIPSETPSKFTIDGEEYELEAYQKQSYDSIWAATVSETLDALVASDQFQKAGQKQQAKMLSTLYKYATEQAKHALFDDAKQSSHVDKIAEFEKAGMDMIDYLDVYAAGIDPKAFLKQINAGVSYQAAFDLLSDIDRLEPAEGSDKVSYVQRWRACVDSSGKTSEQLSALKGNMTESQYVKAELASKFGVNPDAYVSYYELRGRYDANGNGSYSQAEVTAAIDTMDISTKQKAALWQIVTGSKNAKSNPYSSQVGQQVLDAQEKDTKLNEKPKTFGEEVTRQILRNWGNN